MRTPLDFSCQLGVVPRIVQFFQRRVSIIFGACVASAPAYARLRRLLPLDQIAKRLPRRQVRLRERRHQDPTLTTDVAHGERTRRVGGRPGAAGSRVSDQRERIGALPAQVIDRDQGLGRTADGNRRGQGNHQQHEADENRRAGAECQKYTHE